MNKLNLSKKVIAILMFALVISFSNSLLAQHGMGMGHGKGDCTKMDRQTQGFCKMIPNLTDEQSKKIDALLISHKKEVLPIKNEINEKKARLRTLQTAEKVDMIAINKTIEETGALKTNLMKKKAAHQQEVRKLLNDEQKLFFDTHLSKGKGHRCGQNFSGANCPKHK